MDDSAHITESLREKMKKAKEKEVLELIREQYLLTQSYHTNHEDSEAFKLIYLREAIEDSMEITCGILTKYF
jgi:hypothetical protein